MEAEATGKQSGKKIYFGWFIVAVGFLVMVFSYAPSYAMLGLFIKPLAEEFEIARTMSTAISALSSVSGMVTSLFAGRFLVAHDIRRTAMLALGIQSINYLVCYSFAPSIVLVMVGAFINGALNMLITTIPISILINNWFGCKLRGKALSIAMVGSGVGGTVLAPIVGTIIENFGWRMGYRFFAVLSLCLIPLVWAAFVRHPQNKGLATLGCEDATDGCEAPVDTLGGIPAKTARRLPMFWLFVVGTVLTSGAAQTWNVNNAPFFSDQGFSVIQVAFLVSVCQIGLSVSKLLAGAISDKWGPKWAFTFCAGGLIAGFSLAIFVGRASFLAYPATILAGAGIAIPTVVTALLTRDLFGNKDYAPLLGIAECAMKLGSATLPLTMSIVYDAVGHYTPALIGVAVLCAAGLGLVLAAFRLKPASRQRHWVE
ncbi:MAG: MFS transporter [Oscillospiraceae bacterium]